MENGREQGKREAMNDKGREGMEKETQLGWKMSTWAQRNMLVRVGDKHSGLKGHGLGEKRVLGLEGTWCGWETSVQA